MQFTIDRKAVKAVSYFAAHRDIRYYLNGVLLEANRLQMRLVATDGHAAGIYYADAKGENTGACQIIIPNDAVAQLAKLKQVKRMDDVITLIVPDDIGANRDQECRAEYYGAVIVFKPIEGKFPDYRRVIPASLSGVPVQFNPELLMRCRKAALAMGEKNGGVHVGYNGEDAALVRMRSDLIAVVMPLRANVVAAPAIEEFAWAKEQLPNDMPETVPEAIAE